MSALRLKQCLTGIAALFLAACSLVEYQPLATINQIDTRQGYRLQHSLRQQTMDDIFIILMISGGGSRAAALGYGVLEALARESVFIGGRERKLIDSIDLVYGVSGGAVLAAYYALHGKESIPMFEKRFLKQNFQSQIMRQVFSTANLPRLTSPEFGRGDLLQEQFESALFGKATFGDLSRARKGPFAVISATDMALGTRLDFTQEYFDVMCLDLSQLRIARAVAASSAVPLVFSPLTLNNHGGHCGYTLPPRILQAVEENSDRLQSENRREFARNLRRYEDSRTRPYIHLLDGGLSDNLGLRSLLDSTEIYPENLLYQQLHQQNIKKIVIISVNAQNQMNSDIDKTAAIPGLPDVLSAIIDIPIDQHSLETLRRFRTLVDNWNSKHRRQTKQPRPDMHFISLNLRDLPPSPLRDKVLNIPTRFFLPPDDVNHLKQAAHQLLAQSGEYQQLRRALSASPAAGF